MRISDWSSDVCSSDLRALAVDRLAQRVDDAAEPGIGRAHQRLALHHLGFAAEADALQRAEGQQQRAALAKADDLADDAPIFLGTTALSMDGAARADRQRLLEADDFDQHAEHAGDATVQAVVDGKSTRLNSSH